uniref:FBD-associated F-box protein n=3 Tax=Noccaea caerulescens TaxID=107243 RepID=A0A1J3FPT9_NOCCA
MIDEPIRLPQSLYTCGTLVALKLENVSLVDIRFPVCFQLLKTLHLYSVIFLDDETPRKLLASCPILEVLDLNRAEDDNVETFTVTVPSLQRFIYCATEGGTELVMNTPSLNYFHSVDFGYRCVIENLPEIVEAHVQVICSNTDDILRSLAPLKRLLLCLPSESPFPSGSIFHQLEHLEFCTCEIEWDLLMSMLQHSPKLRSLRLNKIHDKVLGYHPLHWDEPSSVPETLVLLLETFEWRNYRGWEIERELASFILKHSRRLKIATFSPPANTVVRVGPRTTLKQKYGMITELARLPRGSTECELVFG